MSASSPFDARFSGYAVALEAFAHAHSVLIEKYVHDAPVWSFCFAHPQGGQAKLDLSIADDGTVKLQTVWWIDNYAAFSRSLRWGDTLELPRESATMLATLRQALREVLDWRPGGWNQVAGGYEAIWGRYTEAQFLAMTPQWPEPRI